MPFLHVIIPTRGRPNVIAEISKAFRDTCGMQPADKQTRLTFTVDADDPALPEYRATLATANMGSLDGVNFSLGNVLFPVVPDLFVHTGTGGTGMADALNATITDLLENLKRRRASGWDTNGIPDAFGFMGDDHRPRTYGWAQAYLTAIGQGADIVYGNDLLQQGNLPTQVAIRAQVIERLGFMVPPGFRHMYIDNVWKSWGEALGTLAYLPDVIVEHCHPVAGKAQWDDNYVRVDQNTGHDQITYMQYIRANLVDDIITIKAGA